MKEQFGTNTPVYHKTHYNSRSQICDVRASNVNDEWGGELGALVNYYSTPYAHCDNGTNNNGNLLMSQTIINSVLFEDRYSYDSLNRLTGVSEYQNGTTFTGTQEYDYDRWGNRTIKPTSTLGTNKQFTVNAANNRLGVPSGQSGVMSYDLAGNLTHDTYTGAGNRTYDGENKITSAWGGDNREQLYRYDASGQRIKRTVDGVETWQVYGLDGELVAEYPANGAATSPQKEYGYRNGELLVTAEPGSSSATQNVNWTNVVGVSASGNSLTKTAATGWGNAGAASTQTLTSGDGYIEFTVTELNTYRMVGLSNGDSSQDWTDIDFAMMTNCDDPGNLKVRITEAGVLRGDFGTLTTGDKLRVAVEGGVVKYRRNGTLLYTSSVAPSYPLSVDTALYSNNSTISSVVVSVNFSNTQNVSWTSAVGVSASGNSLTKTAATGWGNAGAVSTQTLTSGDGYVEFTASELNTYRMVGLSNGDSSQSWTDIDFALMTNCDDPNNLKVRITEAGVLRGDFGTYTTGDKLRVAVEGGVVKYRRNGTLLYTSSVNPSYPLLVDTALYSNASTLTNVVLSSGGGGSSSANVSWLVSDHLGTPRMIIDQSGTLANVKRHDYLPFGEELFAPTGGRSATLGYVSGDGVRQQFTLKERDVETGLDYFLARYYSANQGRFTSVDPFNIALDTQEAAELNPARARALFNAYLSQPQQWNRYAYAINNPLLYIDPNGEAIQLSNDKNERDRQMQALREAVGPEAAQYLYVNPGTNADGTANYYVGIYEGGPNGNGPTFERLNEVAGEFGAIIRDPQVVKLEFVGPGAIADDYGDRTIIGRASSSGVATSGATGYFKGQLTIKMLDWGKRDIGYLPDSVMSNDKDNMLTPSVLLGHELGHARARMTGYRDRRGNAEAREASLRLENKIRKLQFPNGPTRKRH